ncbi:ribonuclease HI [Devosia sp. Root685]|uniref:ribonuclease HI n=1 Tax=Devosia sp. Root685 TaxID=1736587 RepID=UPI000B108D9A|nr:ribonuclease HI [Devosia sp. Root685]
MSASDNGIAMPTTTYTDYSIHTDGACSGNPGPGGWGAIIIFWEGNSASHRQENCGGLPATTNNQMELAAAIHGIGLLASSGGFDPALTIKLYSDSEYVVLGMSVRLEKWKANGWRTSDKKPVKNRELWEKLDQTVQGLNIEWRWTKGHAGNPLNERADALARKGMEPFLPAAAA